MSVVQLLLRILVSVVFFGSIQPTAHFGALVFGSDIDGRQMRGKGK